MRREWILLILASLILLVMAWLSNSNMKDITPVDSVEERYIEADSDGKWKE